MMGQPTVGFQKYGTNARRLTVESQINRRFPDWLLAAGFAFIATTSQPASGDYVSPRQTAAVKVGMSTTEVRQILGQPSRTNQFRTAPGPSWTYEMFGTPFPWTEFDVDFGADGKVTSAVEVVQPAPF